jgi:hypothetical protein
MFNLSKLWALKYRPCFSFSPGFKYANFIEAWHPLQTFLEFVPKTDFATLEIINFWNFFQK